MESTWAVAGGFMRSFEQLEGGLSKRDFGEWEGVDVETRDLTSEKN
jgi:hypothetical protein